MTTATDILTDTFGRVHELLHEYLPHIDAETLLWRPDSGSNSIGWLAWHLTRVQDDHLAGVGESEQVWTSEGFAERFGLPYEDADIGYGHNDAEVAAFSVKDPQVLLAYHDAVHALTLRVLGGLDDAGYARVVDDAWDPPVTAAVRLVSVVGDCHQHLGQIGYLVGLAGRRR